MFFFIHSSVWQQAKRFALTQMHKYITSQVLLTGNAKAKIARRKSAIVDAEFTYSPSVIHIFMSNKTQNEFKMLIFHTHSLSLCFVLFRWSFCNKRIFNTEIAPFIDPTHQTYSTNIVWSN